MTGPNPRRTIDLSLVGIRSLRDVRRILGAALTGLGLAAAEWTKTKGKSDDEKLIEIASYGGPADHVAHYERPGARLVERVVSDGNPLA